jgi:hypothetical protein
MIEIKAQHQQVFTLDGVDFKTIGDAQAAGLIKAVPLLTEEQATALVAAKDDVITVLGTKARKPRTVKPKVVTPSTATASIKRGNRTQV